ncbi:hypothetical protein GCM10009850_122260 [Nonomuraea monospora]|uniref:DUF4244 domain-containing protein n=1 Tax=Nonomuraea monospora TaxID=568818 RepID=A0ABN3D5A9_9ACTN
MHSPATKPDDIAAAPAQAGTTTSALHPGRQTIRSPTAFATTTPTPAQHHDRTANATTAAAFTPKRHTTTTGRSTSGPSTSGLADPRENLATPAPSSADRPQTPSPAANRRRITNSRPRTNKWLHYAAAHREHGMSTAEYAVGTIAACAFAALLFKVVNSPEVQEMLTSLIDRALKTGQE